jgi:hypothetical protein
MSEVGVLGLAYIISIWAIFGLIFYVHESIPSDIQTLCGVKARGKHYEYRGMALVDQNN